MQGHFHPTLYVNKWGNKKTIQTIHKTLHKPYIPLIFRALQSVQFALQTIHKLYTNYTLKRSKPYTKGGGKPYTERYMEAFKTLHETERKPCTKRSAVYLGALLSEIRRRPILTGCAPSFSQVRSQFFLGALLVSQVRSQFFLGALLIFPRCAPSFSQVRSQFFLGALLVFLRCAPRPQF